MDGGGWVDVWACLHGASAHTEGGVDGVVCTMVVSARRVIRW